MIGILLIFIAATLGEAGTSIGKYEAEHDKEGIYTMGFLNVLWGTLFILLFGFVSAEGFRFSMASLPTLGIRGVLEIFQAYVTLRAIVEADRSTFGFLRIITIPLLLMADMATGYHITTNHILGISLIALSLIFLFINHGIKKKGSIWVLLSAINAVITISIYQYHINNFNSVAAEQSIFLILLLVFFFVMSVYKENVNPFALLKTRALLIQSAAMGLGVIFASYAFLFAPASVITTGKRSFTILASTLSGKMYFSEKKLSIKLFSYSLIVVGLVFLVLP